MTEAQFKQRFPNASTAFIEANRHLVDRVAPCPQQQPHPRDDTVAEAPRTQPDTRRCLVRLTSYRRRLLDERNLFDKYFVDALVDAGIIHDDSPQWAKIEVFQFLIGPHEVERTTICIYPID